MLVNKKIKDNNQDIAQRHCSMRILTDLSHYSDVTSIQKIFTRSKPEILQIKKNSTPRPD